MRSAGNPYLSLNCKFTYNFTNSKTINDTFLSQEGIVYFKYQEIYLACSSWNL